MKKRKRKVGRPPKDELSPYMKRKLERQRVAIARAYNRRKAKP